MGVRLTTDESKTALFDSVTGLAFGPVFDCTADAESFLEYAEKFKVLFISPARKDLRQMGAAQLNVIHSAWVKWHEAGEPNIWEPTL